MLLLTLSVVMDTVARPEFAAQEEKECSFCHLDLAGGGPRNEVGQIFQDNYFEFPEDFNVEAIMAEVEKIAKRLITAVDIRIVYIKTTKVDHSDAVTRAGCISCHSAVDSFYMMQGEFTVNAQASEKVRLTLSNNMGSTLNMFATVDAASEHLYVKMGQFRIPFGIKHNDHNMLLRQGYNLGLNKRDVGIEAGGSTGRIFYNAAVFNGGNFTVFNGGGAVGSDANYNKGWAATVGGAVGPIRGGVSYLLDKPVDRRNLVAGAFLTATHRGIAIEAEVNVDGSVTDDENLLSDIEITFRGYYVGWKYRVMSRLLASGRYELFDPDRKAKGDKLRRVTWSARYTVTDNATLELFYWGNIENNDRVAGAVGRQLAGIDQLILMSHFWF